MNILRSANFIFLLLAVGACTKDDDMKVKDQKIIKDYLLQEEVTAFSTNSGLHYIVKVPGSYPRPAENSTVTVHYTGKLLNGFVFESTDGQQPVQFSLSNVIEGWQEGLQLFGVGGKGTLIIPSYLGYGGTVMPGIPANSVLIFDIHLIKVD